MGIDKTSKIQIKELAEFLALEYEDIQTPLQKIAEHEDLCVYYDDYGNSFDGLLIYDERFYIHLNTKRGNHAGTSRGRFTLAHELGHYFIDNHRIGLSKGILPVHGSLNFKNKNQKIEREADYFASCLLMPSERFSKDCVGNKFSFIFLSKLSVKYNVSLTACAIRFSEIGNHPIMIVYCEDGKIVWKWCSNDFPHKYLDSENGIIPEHSKAGEYFTKNLSINGTEQLWAADWFKCYREDDENNVIYEHCIPYKNKALSIIWED